MARSDRVLLRFVPLAGDSTVVRDTLATTRLLAERVKALGLQPWKAPEPLPPIDEDDIVLVVWMAVEAA